MTAKECWTRENGGTPLALGRHEEIEEATIYKIADGIIVSLSIGSEVSAIIEFT